MNKKERNLQSMIYYLKNKERLNRLKREYFQKNKDWLKEKQKEYNKKNKHKIKEGRKKYRKENKDFIKKCNEEYRKKNKEKIKKLIDNWRKNNPDKVREANRTSKATHRKIGNIELMTNPFPDEISVVYHHIYKNQNEYTLPFTIPIPKKTHFFVGGTALNNEHWKHNEEWIKKVYSLDINNFLFDEFTMEEKNETN